MVRIPYKREIFFLTRGFLCENSCKNSDQTECSCTDGVFSSSPIEICRLKLLVRGKRKYTNTEPFFSQINSGEKQHVLRSLAL